ncbi:MAG: copper chaperone PCu(A)C [Bdellovibrionales bacterium]|nr:copper chaperone PCu(A)C [Bdellovibrionales bacterium]
MNLAKTLIALSISCGAAAHAQSGPPSLKINDGYIFQPLKGSNATAGYGILKNVSGKDAALTVVSAEGFGAVELHETVPVDGLMKMRRIENFHLGKDASFELKPGGNHVMLFDPTKDFKEGDTVHVNFKLDDKSVAVPFQVRLRNKPAKAQR